MITATIFEHFEEGKASKEIKLKLTHFTMFGAHDYRKAKKPMIQLHLYPGEEADQIKQLAQMRLSFTVEYGNNVSFNPEEVNIRIDETFKPTIPVK